MVARGLDGVRLYNVVRVGEAALPGEVIRLDGERATIQVYEDTAGLRDRRAGARHRPSAGGRARPRPARSHLRRHPAPARGARPRRRRPVRAPAAPARRRRCRRSIASARGRSSRASRRATAVAPGDLLGVVAETAALEHRILVPPHISGVVTAIRSGPARLEEPVVWIDDQPVTMLSRWPVRDPRPIGGRLDPSTPLITGQRAIDVLFPIARGGAATIPGGFGTGKTVLQQSLAKWAHADVVVYVGCGERGNELTEVLQEFPELVDPRTGASLMERTILIANTSNMPVAAREASIYTGITVAEYFRDQGYHVALMADSTSRWGEALREVSSRLEEMPAEEGYPAYLSSRLARVLRACRRGPLPRIGPTRGLGDDRRRGLAGGRRLLRADHPALAAAGGHVLGARHDARPRSGTSPRSTGTAATRSTTSPTGSRARSPPTGRSTAPGRASCSSARRSCSRSCSCSAPTRSRHPSASCCAPVACCARTSCSSRRSTSTTPTATRASSSRCCGRSAPPTRR